ncbi:unnamed protein product [Candidula unifasciata]|uniref:tRNA N(3)-methylcytidine methyltransferase n=1 Tax=Candidula unifasciata TaxID=100452 RepID=A0A8S3YXW7_9EUPU|nr:unnamed protein product [Candidula unifasciata]
MENGELEVVDEKLVSGDDSARTKFGTRYLTDPQNVFQHNAWDNAVWDEDQEITAQKIAKNHADRAVSIDRRDVYEKEAAKNWNQFYNIHTNHFFKDRHWLFTEFPELYGPETFTESTIASHSTSTKSDLNPSNSLSAFDEEIDKVDTGSSRGNKSLITIPEQVSCHDSDCVQQQTPEEHVPFFRLLEVGCGVGNTVFPVLKTNKNPNLFIYCCDFSAQAIDIVKAHPDYDESRCQAFVHDLTADDSEVPFPLESLDIVVMIFVLSAISPERMQSAINRLASYLKSGGTLLFRDYGRYDMAQLRFKEGRCLSENFYVRGDGTRVYFFTQDELRTMFELAGLQEKENIVDRRLQVNRGRQLKMYRVWIQCKYVKPLI